MRRAGALDLAAAPTYMSPVPMEPIGRALQYDATDTVDAIEECYRRGWTDGRPVVPPVADKVADMLASMGLAPEHVVGEVPVRRRVLTAEHAAANAVMAGCLPEHFPVVLAAMEAFFEHDPNILHESCTKNFFSSANHHHRGLRSDRGAYVRMLGVPDFPYVVCPHPITNVGPTDLEARARQLAPGVRRLLLEGRR
jgi:hypothetical protein